LVEAVDDGRFLGGCGLQIRSGPDRRANLGYWVRPSATGQGVGPAAVRLIVGFGLGELGLTRLELVIDVENARSLRVAEKVGAVREGLLRKRLLGKDAVMYSFVAGDPVMG
jgi:RimJ/RimL family protein N-acetyltransferase